MKAIELLSGNEENKEVCEVLGRIVNGRLTVIWNKEMEADPMMHAHASAYIAMGMGYMKVKETYFSDVVKKEEYLLVSRDEWLGKFKVLYKKMGMLPQKVFNNERAEGEGCASTWVRRTGCELWNDLLQKSGFGEAVKRDNNHHCELIVSISESDLSAEAYDRMEETLKKVLT